MYCTENPHADAEAWQDDQEAKEAEYERKKAQARYDMQNAFIEALQWGKWQNLDLPGMPVRTTHDAVGELLDKNSEIVTRALCLMACMKDVEAVRMVHDLTAEWADEAIKEWAP